MTNGYFQLINVPPGGFGLKFYPPKDGGEPLQLAEVLEWLEFVKIPYNAKLIKQFLDSGREIACQLGKGECPAVRENYKLTVTPDSMQAVVRFYPASERGERMNYNEFMNDLKYKNIVSGIQPEMIQAHFQGAGIYCTDILAAQGKEPRQGTDARIQYFFNTDMRVQPTLREDGSVDYFHLNMINPCHVGDVLAKIIPEDPGEEGVNIFGARVKPREVKRASLKFGHHVELTPDKLAIKSQVEGHVMLVEDKVFVSDVYEVENVDISTGNIDFSGSVQINGNVASNYVVRSGGNVIINGVVEGAHIYAQGNIVIARGMNGMGKGTLDAGGNVIAKFIESATVSAENGYVNTESIMHSDVSSGDEIVVNGKKGLITGGRIQAAHRVTAKTLGAEMGAHTVVEVGVNPRLKKEFVDLQKEMAEVTKAIRNAQPILANFTEKRAKGANFTQEQMKYIRSVAAELEENKNRLIEMNTRLTDLQQQMDDQRKASVEVTGEVFPGTTIVIGDSSMVVQSNIKFCKFERVSGEVKMVPL
ncbi:MAG: DUF342 domain-containing protein [Lachnospiraceae bacterium]|nr:DUF342 domain-containing protein [Lachnospiraceae bacterium]